jgi:uncharacterized protein YjbI with pentapeptide repeats
MAAGGSSLTDRPHRPTDLTWADLGEADFADAHFNRAELRGADLGGASAASGYLGPVRVERRGEGSRFSTCHGPS